MGIYCYHYYTNSGAGTNLKVGRGIRPTRKRLSCLSTFSALVRSTSKFSRCGERFRDGRNSLASFLFAVFFSTRDVPPAQPFVNCRWITCPGPSPMESAPVYASNNRHHHCFAWSAFIGLFLMCNGNIVAGCFYNVLKIIFCVSGYCFILFIVGELESVRAKSLQLTAGRGGRV